MEIIDGDSEEFVFVKEEIVRSKHSTAYMFLIVNRVGTDEYYGINYERNYNDGIQDYYDVCKLKRVEKLVYTYEKVKDGEGSEDINSYSR